MSAAAVAPGEQVGPSDRTIWSWLGVGFFSAVVPTVVARVLAEFWSDVALLIVTVQAFAAGAVIPVVAVMGLLDFLEDSPLVLWLREKWRPVSEAAGAAIVLVRRELARRDVVTLLGVGYLVGSALMEFLVELLGALPDVHVGWNIGGLSVSAAVLFTADRLLAYSSRSPRS